MFRGGQDPESVPDEWNFEWSTAGDWGLGHIAFNAHPWNLMEKEANAFAEEIADREKRRIPLGFALPQQEDGDD